MNLFSNSITLLKILKCLNVNKMNNDAREARANTSSNLKKWWFLGYNKRLRLPE